MLLLSIFIPSGSSPVPSLTMQFVIFSYQNHGQWQCLLVTPCRRSSVIFSYSNMQVAMPPIHPCRWPWPCLLVTPAGRHLSSSPIKTNLLVAMPMPPIVTLAKGHLSSSPIQTNLSVAMVMPPIVTPAKGHLSSSPIQPCRWPCLQVTPAGCYIICHLLLFKPAGDHAS
jgi:hypothetical protein